VTISTEMALGPTAVRARTAYRTEALEGRAAFDALGPEWNRLVARGPVDVPFVRHEWISAWLDAFAPDAPLHVIVARGRAGEAVGMAPLLEERHRGLVRLVAPANDHSCRVEWALGPDVAGAVGAIWEHLRDRLRWDVLLLRDLQRDGPTAGHLEALARADRHPSGRWESMRSPWVPLGGEPVEARISAKLRQNLRRRLRRLGETGAVSVRRVDGSDGLSETFEAFLALEAAGWKGARGTAIARDPRLVRFYRAIVTGAAARGELALRALELDGRAVAVHLGLVHAGSYHLPKTAYDESLAAVSPGQLLQREVLAECEARGLAAFEFLGPDMEWKRDWEPRHRPHDWLYVYRPGLVGRAMHTLKHRVRPVVKEVAAWWR
jgi:CelD/BcsL family acetyltransferase involved in cellulose biosynthesis